MKNHTDIATFETVPLNLLEDYIKAEIYDQDEAVKDVTDSIAMLQYGLNDSDKPIHSMLFLGPTGVGKTELAIVLSKALFGRKDIVRIDMSEYSQPHHVEKLFGSAPGYVGYGQETKLTREIKRRNKGIILLDEIEKAHPEVHNALLQLLDYGKFTTGTGAVIDATGYIIIMTSNALVKEAGSFTKQIGFGEKIISDVKNDQKARKLLIERENFSPEFVNRIDSVIYFDSISDRTAEKILIKFMKEMKDSLMDKGITLTWSEAYIKDLISKRDPNFGGRGVRRLTSTPKMEIISILRKNPSLKEINLDVSEENPSRLSTKSILS
jgi:ATP-dependent Clp protease ATP-binding subunit ClpA